MFNCCALVSILVFAASPTAPNAAEQATDPFLGDWQSEDLVAQVIPRGDGRYEISLLPEFDVRCQPLVVVQATAEDRVLRFAQNGWSGRAQAGHMSVSGMVRGEKRAWELEHVQRLSPTVGAEPPQGAVVLFDGSGFEHWQRHGGRSPGDEITWELCEDYMRVAPVDKQTLAGHSLVTKKAFRDFRLHLEFRLPLMADKTGQARANGGLTFEDANWYEVQILDSYGLEGKDNECGGIYKIAAPAVNMCRPPLMWQTYDIEFHAPRYDDEGYRTQPGRITVVHNGTCIHDNVTLPDSPKAEQRRRANPDGVSAGRIILHYHKNPIEYRNIWLQELAAPVTTAQKAEPVLVRSEAPDWPQWRGPARDGISTETGLLADWPEDGPPQLWTAEGIGRGYSSPIVVGQTIYITGDRADDLVISAFALDGTLRWETKNGAAWKRSYPGVRSSCTYDSGRLYHMNAHGRLACLNADTGAELWAVNVLERFEGKNITWGISESVAILGHRVFATPAGDKGLVVALDKRTGETVWATPAIEDEEPSYASPILVNTAGRTLLVNSAAQNAFAVDAETGQLCWKVTQEDPKNTVSTIPVLARSHCVFTNASRGYGAVFGVRLDDLLGDKTWKQELTISHGSTIGVDGQVYGASGRGVARGWLAIDPETGSIATLSSLDGGSLIYADGRFYCLTQRGAMTLQKRVGDRFETMGRFQVAEGRDIWAHPVVCHGRLYLRVHETLFCYDIRP